MYIALIETTTGGHSRSTDRNYRKFDTKAELETFVKNRANASSRVEYYEAKKMDVKITIEVKETDDASD